MLPLVVESQEQAGNSNNAYWKQAIAIIHVDIPAEYVDGQGDAAAATKFMVLPFPHSAQANFIREMQEVFGRDVSKVETSGKIPLTRLCFHSHVHFFHPSLCSLTEIGCVSLLFVFL